MDYLHDYGSSSSESDVDNTILIHGDTKRKRVCLDDDDDEHDDHKRRIIDTTNNTNNDKSMEYVDHNKNDNTGKSTNSGEFCGMDMLPLPTSSLFQDYLSVKQQHAIAFMSLNNESHPNKIHCDRKNDYPNPPTTLLSATIKLSSDIKDSTDCTTPYPTAIIGKNDNNLSSLAESLRQRHSFQNPTLFVSIEKEVLIIKQKRQQHRREQDPQSIDSANNDNDIATNGSSSLNRWGHDDNTATTRYEISSRIENWESICNLMKLEETARRSLRSQIH